jgi:hypothetical protein
MSQHDKIKQICADGEFHCQIEFWNAYIRSPHKRRAEIEKKGYLFEPRPCTHGQKRSYDYRMVKIEPKVESRQSIQSVLYPIPESQKVWTL